MARGKKKSSSSRSKKSVAPRKDRKQKPEKKRRETGQTWGDYLGMSFSPILIMLMVGCLIFFFITSFYEGFYAKRLYYIMFSFTIAVVLVSRISILMGGTRAGIYGAALAVVTALVIKTYISNPIPAILLLGVIWWCAKKITWDCTLINDEEDASGEGLLQLTGFEKRLAPVQNKVPFWKRLFLNKSEREGQPHAPGVWILYFSFAAIPVFGLGQFLVEIDGPDGPGAAKRMYMFKLLMIYMAAALGLLLVTSLLGLRRYLRQRGVQMPSRLVWTWLISGAALILLLVLGGFFLPRPSLLADFGPMTALTDLKVGTDYTEDKEDSLLKLGYGVDRDDPDVDPDLMIDVPLNEEEKEEKEREERVKLPEKKEEELAETPPEDKQDEVTPPEEKDSELLASLDQNEPPPEEEPKEPDPQPEAEFPKPEATPESPEVADPMGTETEAVVPEVEVPPEPETQPEPEQTPPPEEEPPPPEPEKPEPEKPPEPEVQTAETDWFMLAMYTISLLFLLVVAYLLYRYRNAIGGFFSDLWAKLFGKKKTEEDPEGEGDEQSAGEQILVLAPPEPPKPFRTFHNPFEDGSADKKSNAAVVCYTFDALEAWAYEHDKERPPEQTPMEFCYHLERQDTRFDNSAKQLSRWYTSYAYAEREPEDSCRPELERVWQVMLNKPEEVLLEEDDLEEFEVVRDEAAEPEDDMDTAELPVHRDRQD
ncbi:MAG: hypothetical protein R3C11_10170 [Planctomycetaceae bacterium]